MATSKLLFRVLAALQSGDNASLNEIYNSLSSRLVALKTLNEGEHGNLIGKSLYRDISAETLFVPRHVGEETNLKFMALK